MSSFFNNTSHCSFQGNITNVAGDYYINQVVNSEDKIVSHGVRGESIFDEYEYVRQGDMRLLQQLSEVNEEPWWPERLKSTKTTYKIDLLGRGHKEATGALPYRIAVRYSGKNAYSVWEQDFVKYSNPYSSHLTLFLPSCS
ncbi:hypothetical protein K435DRAFT_880532 [Dendrothele bispora CBS 962.96]|uniref:Uncharacterized protein n=1 Tax=Dendrothele bispora (strain CBS 962.96) TaxID=1314807 RepID=A0A4S8KJG0_DENBC|nr:hypothetical protein K435DRAFT_880532 [Dendrothele bispora CBS 962.96]